ncbi:MAG: DedA family protein [Candidatus Pelagibacter sp. TMED106]|jgi:uncharacterized membrane protein YdjX (TVP38/TMEM64 family)|nr:MAG: DedA family protein [Candidatus Pelagibacter sp. TMED106]|tara:strand:+ start:62 stop:787 length:726 start_codon:yes stop_codon:yes gene_type:complete
MEKAKKIKIIVGLFYFFLVLLFLYFFFSKFSLDELTSYEFIKNNREFFFDLKNKNLILLLLIFFISTIFWVLMAGFGSPVALLAGFIFGKWLGLIIVILGLSTGASFLYIFGNYFLKDIIREKFSSRFKNLETKFKKSEFLYLLVYRFVGGIPFALSNVIPCIFNVRVSNFFWATFIGIIPQIFLLVLIGSGLEEIINKNLQAPNIKDLIFSPEIYKPFIAFFILVIITIIVRKFFYKKND